MRGQFQQQNSEQGKRIVKLDFSISSPKERNELVKKLIEATPPQELTSYYLDYLGKYIINSPTKGHVINTDNRLKTINKHETSYEGLAEKFLEGQDGLYRLFSTDGKGAILTPKISITEQDLIDIPYLKTFRKCIENLQKQANRAEGKRKFLLKKQIIQMRQDQYVIKSFYKPPVYTLNAIKSFHKIAFNDIIQVIGEQIIDNSLISFFNPKHISLLLCNYSKIKQDSYGDFQSDAYYLMMDFEDLIDAALKQKYPLYYDLIIHKIDKKSNLEIRGILKEDFGITYSVEYLSVLWRNKIPKLIANYAIKDYLLWYYTYKEKGKWKRCSKCGEIKPAMNLFFSRNNTARDGLYSLCKDCRNKKKIQHRLTQEEKTIKRLGQEVK